MHHHASSTLTICQNNFNSSADCRALAFLGLEKCRSSVSHLMEICTCRSWLNNDDAKYSWRGGVQIGPEVFVCFRLFASIAGATQNRLDMLRVKHHTAEATWYTEEKHACGTVAQVFNLKVMQSSQSEFCYHQTCYGQVRWMKGAILVLEIWNSCLVK